MDSCNSKKIVPEIKETPKKIITCILVVDDVPMMFDVIQKYFKYKNYKILFYYAKTGYIAKDLIIKHLII